MAQYLLIHGAWHGAWCWDATAAALRRSGHEVTAIDLPSHGDDTTPAADVTLESYVARIGAALAEASAPVILVGHSMGGMAISQAAEAFPEKIARLVYVAAFLPRDGESLSKLEERNPRPTIPNSLVVAADAPTAVVRDDVIVPAFFHDCAPAVQQAAKARLTVQSLAPLTTPVRLTAARFGKIPRVYIECTDDRAISIELQRDMVAASGVDKVVTLASSHSPFLSMPEALAAELAGIA